MSNELTFPSGRSVSRCRQDAKALVKQSKIAGKAIQLHEALDLVAKNNGMDHTWHQSLANLSLSHKKSPKVAQMHLLGHALNVVLSKRLIDLHDIQDRESGHLECILLNKPTAITWSYIGCGEIQFSVWWNFDKTRHPQHLDGGYKHKIIVDTLSTEERHRLLSAKKGIHSHSNTVERYLSSAPLAKKSKYPEFVGVVCSTWIERKTGIYLQTEGGRRITDSYVRSIDKDALCSIPDCRPMGFDLAGKFHM